MRRLINILLFLMVAFVSIISAKANSECDVYLKLSNEQIQQGENVTLSLFVKSETDIDIATFGLKIYFDETKLDFKKLEAKSNIDNSEFKYSVKNGVLTVIYLKSNEGIDINANTDFEIVDFVFNVLDTSTIGTTEFNADISGIGDNDINEIFCSGISPVSFSIFCPEISNCRLKNLKVSEGTLVPDFDPYITEYTLSVPYEVKSIEVFATPQDESDTVKVNRKTLGKAGSYTDINVTVTSADKTKNVVYKINTYRGLKESSSSNSDSSTSNTSKASTTSNKSSISSKSSKSSTSSKTASSTATGSKTSSSSSKTNNTGNTVSNSSDVGGYYDKCDAETNSILVRKNSFSSFIFGILISGVCGIIIYIVYKYEFKAKKKYNKNKS